MPRSGRASAAEPGSTIRVKVAVAGDTQSPARWLLVDRSQCRTIGDVETRLRALHPTVVGRGGHGLSLSLDGALLSPQEDVAILRDGETVSIYIPFHIAELKECSLCKHLRVASEVVCSGQMCLGSECHLSSEHLHAVWSAHENMLARMSLSCVMCVCGIDVGLVHHHH